VRIPVRGHSGRRYYFTYPPRYKKDVGKFKTWYKRKQNDFAETGKDFTVFLLLKIVLPVVCSVAAALIAWHLTK